jgi:hypothetical protein
MENSNCRKAGEQVQNGFACPGLFAFAKVLFTNAVVF